MGYRTRVTRFCDECTRVLFSQDFNCGLKSLEVSWFRSGRFVVFF